MSDDEYSSTPRRSPASEIKIEDFTPQPEPFNGATRVVLAQDAFDAIAPHMHAVFAPHAGPRLEVNPVLPNGHGIGYRAWREGDDPFATDGTATIVWTLSPKLPKE